MNPYAIEFGFTDSQLRRFRIDSDKSMKSHVDRKRAALGLLSMQLITPLLMIGALLTHAAIV